MKAPTPEQIRESFISLVDRLLKCGTVSEIDGDFKCNKCGSHIHIDWFEKAIECTGCDDAEE